MASMPHMHPCYNSLKISLFFTSSYQWMVVVIFEAGNQLSTTLSCFRKKSSHEIVCIVNFEYQRTFSPSSCLVIQTIRARCSVVFGRKCPYFITHDA